jgi:hypothetical protein
MSGYYAATAVFLVLDLAAGINVRLAFLEGMPGWRAAYYGFCFACLAGMIARPAAEALIGVVESAVTLTALIISMMLRSMFIVDIPLDGSYDPVTIEEVVNFMISGSFAYYAYTQGMKQFRGIS